MIARLFHRWLRRWEIRHIAEAYPPPLPRLLWWYLNRREDREVRHQLRTLGRI